MKLDVLLIVRIAALHPSLPWLARQSQALAASGLKRALSVSKLDGSALQVLLADDDPLVLGTLAAALNYAGHSVITADTVAAAVGAAGRGRFDVIVADLTLRGGDLQELLDMASGAPAAVPVLIVTGAVDRSLQAGALAAGAARLLQKPFDLTVLFDTLQVLAHRQQTVPQAAAATP